MKKLIVLFCALVVPCLAAAQVVKAAPRNLKKHALPKVMLAPLAVAKVAPKAALTVGKVAGKGLGYTIGSVLFTAEAGVDVAHAATDVLDKGVAAEGFKKNPFHYVNKVVGYADT